MKFTWYVETSNFHPSSHSDLVLIDALTFAVIDRAWLPHNIPWSAHGMHFPEAKWTL